MQSVRGLDDFLKGRRTPAKASDQPTDTMSPSETARATDQTDPEAHKTDKKEKSADELKAELSSQAKANLRLGKERADLTRKLDEAVKRIAELEAKAAGTYVEPTAEQKERESVIEAEFKKFQERQEQSRDEAIKEFGEEYVLSNIYMDESPFAKVQKEQPWLVQRIMAAEKPVHEAIAVLNEQAVLKKFGRTEAEVLKAAEAILKPMLFEAFTKELEQREGEGVKPAPRVPSLNQARTAGSDGRAPGTEPVRTFSALNLNPHNRV